MNIYLISQTTNNSFDTYDSAIVGAESVEEAQKINPSSGWGGSYPGWADKPEQVDVLLIGKAVDGTAAGVILASFNAA